MAIVTGASTVSASAVALSEGVACFQLSSGFSTITILSKSRSVTIYAFRKVAQWLAESIRKNRNRSSSACDK